MSRRLHQYSIGIAASAAMAQAWITPLVSSGNNDPYESRPRSKGEKARNRKFRGGRP